MPGNELRVRLYHHLQELSLAYYDRRFDGGAWSRDETLRCSRLGAQTAAPLLRAASKRR
jgi:hypothetical protein